MADGTYAGDLAPGEAWQMLESDPRATLVDVRTTAEWQFVGMPDLSGLDKRAAPIEWQQFPGGQRNAQFLDQLAGLDLAPDAPVLFLCRSGGRSRAAAIAATAAGFTKAYNISEGFEGDCDQARHRGSVGGWKVAGLPWQQG
jgi:rhodanese-related sulfurtransferase